MARSSSPLRLIHRHRVGFYPMNRPEILVYGPSEGPEHMRYAAAMVPILKPGKTSKAKDPYFPGSQWLCTAPSAEEARSKLEALWDRQYPPVDKRKGPRPKGVTLNETEVVL